jgi:hypothetical protein
MNKILLIAAIAATSVLAACVSAPKQTSVPAAAATPAAKPVAAAGMTGTWALNVETPMGAREMKLNAIQNGEALTGTVGTQRGDVPITGTVVGNAVAFMMKVNAQGMDMQIDYKGMIEGDTIKGTMKLGDLGEGTFTGKRQ